MALIGGGIMSATLGTMLKQLQPDWSIQVFEKLGEAAEESSNPWNNAGTGHSALCELNYTPQRPDGSIEIASAVKVNEQFQVSRQFWSHLVETGDLPEPSSFINPTPHMSFVWGQDNVDYLRKRFEALKDHPLFEGIEYSEDARVIRGWAPVLIPGRAKSQPIAATRVAAGTDVNFGALTDSLMKYLADNDAEITYNAKVTAIKRQKDGLWRITYRREVGLAPFVVFARFVFVGAGGNALNLLQKSGIPEIRGFGGFPVSGEFLRTDNPELVARHQAKVYGMAAVGAPPMSVPHLDTRVIDGSSSLLFGPYAGFSTKYLKTGSYLDLFAALRWHNIGTFVGAGLKNLSLVWYLVTEVLSTKRARFRALQQFAPTAEQKDWYLITAGQRVQIMKRGADGKAVIQFGTEVVSGADGTIAGLLGASPGASTAVPIMLDIVKRCFPDRMKAWEPRIRSLVPSYGSTLNDAPETAERTVAATSEALALRASV